MKKRELIIIIIASVVVLYGLLDFFVLSKKGPAGQEEKITAELNNITAFAASAGSELSSAAKAKNLFPDVDYLISKAESPWQADPFIVYGANQADTALDADELPPLSYTGFIEAGQKKLAIVNGMEYSPGEMLKDIGYTVHSITASHVVLLTESEKEIILHLEEN